MKAGILKQVKGWVFHHYLLALIPILSLYQDNNVQLTLHYLLRPVLVSLLFAILIFFVIKLVTKDKDKSALMTSTLLFFIFYHAPIRIFFYRTFRIRQILFFLIWIIVFIILVLLVGFSKRKLQKVNQFLNIFTFISLMALALMIGMFELNQSKVKINRFPGDLQVLNNPVKPYTQQKPPDIYYIILDGYGREDVLNNLYKLDVSNFKEFLTEQGFYIATDSHTNYGQTLFSLASSLNLRYLDPLIKKMGRRSENRRPLIQLIENNDLFDFLKRNGYEIVAFDSGYPGTAIRHQAQVKKHWFTLHEFESILINSTLLRGLLTRVNYRSHIKRIRYILNKIGKLKSKSKPKFVFAHLLCPHPPFVFKANGDTEIPDTDFTYSDGNHFIINQKTQLEYILGYRNQVAFINSQIKSIVRKLLQNEKNKPIIILQGDHGPGSQLHHESMAHTNLRERLAILNAFYFPAYDYQNMYKKITPVNTFRMILNIYFGANLKLLQDKIYYLRWSQPYNPIEIKASKAAQ